MASAPEQPTPEIPPVIEPQVPPPPSPEPGLPDLTDVPPPDTDAQNMSAMERWLRNSPFMLGFTEKTVNASDNHPIAAPISPKETPDWHPLPLWLPTGTERRRSDRGLAHAWLRQP